MKPIEHAAIESLFLAVHHGRFDIDGSSDYTLTDTDLLFIGLLVPASVVCKVTNEELAEIAQCAVDNWVAGYRAERRG